MATTSSSFLVRTDGSATWRSSGGCYVIASATGPIEVSKRDEDPERAFLDVIVRPPGGMSGTPYDELIQQRISSALRAVVALELHPRTLIQVVVQLVEPGTAARILSHSKLDPIQTSGLLASSINAAYVALLDAGIPLRASIAATSIVVAAELGPNKRQTVLVDPVRLKDSKLIAAHSIAYEMKDNIPSRLILLESIGKSSMNSLFQCLDSAKLACVDNHQLVRTYMQNLANNKVGY
ncbi:uncharacterized protein V1516DRAFT_682012 [Lipomyces oligophaga]|uniref:uncharacterized protein n=1 Tax=Lipomyces oligophaga TaxID=45792 RepID=UPI0034CE852C